MTSCDRIIPLFSLQFEGESSPAEDAFIRAHLLECAGCRQEYSDLKETMELVRGLPTIEAPDGFEAQVLFRLRAAQVTQERSADVGDWEPEDVFAFERPTILVIENRWWEHWMPRFAGAAAAAAVVALALVGGPKAFRPGAEAVPGLASTSPGVSDLSAANTASSRSSGEWTRSQAAVEPRRGVVAPSYDGDPSGTGVGVETVGAGTRSSVGQASVGQASVGQAGGFLLAGVTPGNAPSSADSRQFDDLRSLFPDIPAEVIRAMPLNGETYASDRLVMHPGSINGGTQVVAPVEYRSVEPVYIYR